MDDLQYPQFGGSYYLEDEEQEKERRRREQELRNEAAAGAMQQPSAAPPRGGLSSLLTPRDPEMESRWRGAEQQALDRSGFQGGQSYGAGEAVRDFAPMVIGGGLDILLNKGRGLGALAGAGMQANQIEEARRQKEAQSAGEFALRARGQREQQGSPELDAAYKDAQMKNWIAQNDVARENLRLHTDQTGLRKTKQDYDLNPENPEAARRADVVQDLSGVNVSGMSNKGQGALSGLLSGNQRLNNAGPISDSQNRSDVTYAAPKAAQSAIGSEEGKNAAASTTADTRKKLGETPEVDKITQTYATQFAKDNDAAIKLMSAANAVWGSTRNDEGELPGFSRKETAASMVPGGGNLLTPDAKRNQQLKAVVEEFFSRDQSGAAISKNEQKKFLYELFGDPTTSAFDKEQALDNFMSTIVLPAMRARSAGNPKAANMVLSAAGLDIGSAAPKGAPAGARQNLGPDGDHPSNLGVQRPVPGGAKAQAQGRAPMGGGSVNGGAGAAKRMRIIEDPDTGEVENEMLSDEEAQRLVSSGLKVR